MSSLLPKPDLYGRVEALLTAARGAEALGRACLGVDVGVPAASDLPIQGGRRSQT